MAISDFQIVADMDPSDQENWASLIENLFVMERYNEIIECEFSCLFDFNYFSATVLFTSIQIDSRFPTCIGTCILLLFQSI